MTQSPDSPKRIELETIFEIMRDRICLRIYEQGTVLHEGVIADEFEVSRTPIREVLHRLSSAGLVESKNGVGTIVTQRSLEEVRQIYELRIQAAMLIGSMAPRKAQSGDISQMEELLRRASALQEEASENQVNEYWLINHQAHFIIGNLIGNAPLKEIWDRYYFQAAGYWYGVVQSEFQTAILSLCRELGDVLGAMQRNDIAAIGYIERNFIAYGLERLTRVHQTSG